MGDLTKNISRYEISCKCGCGFDICDHELVTVIQDAVDALGSRVLITSGNRCVNHNRDCGGAANSKHISGKAADFIIDGVTTDTLATYLNEKYPDKYGIGKYPDGRVHLDIRTTRGRWVKYD